MCTSMNLTYIDLCNPPNNPKRYSIIDVTIYRYTKGFNP